MAAYQALKATYDQQVAAQQTQQGIVIHGQNPGINRKIEQTELKKSSVKMLIDTWVFGAFPAMKQTAITLPTSSCSRRSGKADRPVLRAGVRVGEHHLSLLTRTSGVANRSGSQKITNSRPLFTQFLQAGSARVVVPVHPAYNDAVMYFLENNGAIWSGGEAPRLNDPMFISLADELRTTPTICKAPRPRAIPGGNPAYHARLSRTRTPALPTHP